MNENMLTDGIHDAYGDLIEIEDDLEKVLDVLTYLMNDGMLSYSLEWHKDHDLWEINRLFSQTQSFVQVAIDYLERIRTDINEQSNKLDNLYLKSKNQA